MLDSVIVFVSVRLVILGVRSSLLFGRSLFLNMLCIGSRRMSEKQECRVFVGQISAGVDEREIREVFEKYGEVLGVDYLTKGGGAASYAFVQYKDKDSVEDVLIDKDRIRLGSQGVKVGRANPSNKQDNRGGRNRRDPSQNRQPYSRKDADDDSYYRRHRAADSPARRSISPPAAARKRSASPPSRSFYDTTTTRTERSRRAPSRSRSRSPKSAREYRVTIEHLPSDMSWQELKRLGADYGKSIAFARTSKDREGQVSGLLAFSERKDAENLVASLDGKKMEGCDRRLRAELEIPREPTRKVSPSPADLRRPNSRRY